IAIPAENSLRTRFVRSEPEEITDVPRIVCELIPGPRLGPLLVLLAREHVRGTHFVSDREVVAENFGPAREFKRAAIGYRDAPRKLPALIGCPHPESETNLFQIADTVDPAGSDSGLRENGDRQKCKQRNRHDR